MASGKLYGLMGLILACSPLSGYKMPNESHFNMPDVNTPVVPSRGQGARGVLGRILFEDTGYSAGTSALRLSYLAPRKILVMHTTQLTPATFFRQPLLNENPRRLSQKMVSASSLTPIFPSRGVSEDADTIILGR